MYLYLGGGGAMTLKTFQFSNTYNVKHAISPKNCLLKVKEI